MPKTFARICGIKAECLNHICQDSIAMRQFIDVNGNEVYTGAVSDGCSGIFGTEHGSDFLVRTFVDEVERLGKAGNRKNDFLHRVIMSVIEHMAAYKPKDSRSEITRWNNTDLSGELTATLYGFIADKNQTSLLLAGDGNIIINGHSANINQHKGDLYPSYILQFPKKNWDKVAQNVIYFTEFPSDRIDSLVLATDGFGHPNPESFNGITDDPATFVLQAKFHATKSDSFDGIPGCYASRGGDDATALIFCRTGFSSKDPVRPDEVSKLCQMAANHWTDSLYKAILASRGKEIRPCTIDGDPTDSMIFRRKISNSEGVHLYGITSDDIEKYKRQRDSILSSRICTDDSNPFNFSATRVAKTKAPQTPSETKPSSNIQILSTKEKVLKNSESPKIESRKGMWIPFQEICDYKNSLKLGVGFRHFPFIARDLWNFIQGSHESGLRFGNLRPQDLEFNMRKIGTKEPEFNFRLKSQNVSARVDLENKSKLTKPYGKLDEQFIHPVFEGKLKNDDEARLDHDWFSYKTLLFWIFTKADPFGLGTVKDLPEADRRYRMEKKIYCASKHVQLEPASRLFIERALYRLGKDSFMFIRSTRNSEELREYPEVVLSAFKNGLIKCDNIIIKPNQKRATPCNFARLELWIKCPYCGHSKLQAITYNPT